VKYRVSNVEAFRKWEADPDAEPEDLDRLLADIRGESAPSQAMAAGTAFHACLEHAVAGIDFDSLSHGGFVFTFADQFDIEVTPIRELRASKTYMVDGQPIFISGQVDAIDGLRIEDHKTTGRFDPDRYLTGYQWRLYLDIFGARHFRWNVFEMKEVESTQESFGFEAPAIQYEVFAQHRLEQFRYPALEADCQALVERFARFVREHAEIREAA
jgi:hypothetical protein